MQTNVTLRVIPFLVALFYFDMMTRMNIANVHDKMLPALNMSENSYSTAVGSFFFTYVAFQMPSNVLLRHVRASLQFGIVIILIGVVGASTAFVRNELDFIINRLILGFLQSGCYPGIIFVITKWFPVNERPTKFSYIDFATLGAALSSGFLAAGILKFDKLATLAGWQWVFIIEGAPAIIMGLVIVFYMPDSPQTAKWLTDDQKKAFAEREQAVQKTIETSHKVALKENFIHLFGNWRLLMLSLAYFSTATASYGYSFFAPSIIASMGVSASTSNLITTPLSVGSFVIGLSMARTTEVYAKGKYSRYVIGGAVFSTTMMCLFGLAIMFHYHTLSWVFLVLYAIFNALSFSPFWVWLTTVMRGSSTSTALNIAFANSMANLGGIAGPKIMAHFLTHHGYGAGIVAMAGCMGLAVSIFIFVHVLSSFKSCKHPQESSGEKDIISAIITEEDPLLN